MNKQQLLTQLSADLKTCKPNKKESIYLIIKMLKHSSNEIDSQYNLGCIAECMIKSIFTKEVVKPSPKGIDDLNIELTTKQQNQYFNGVSVNDLDIKYINNYSTAHQPKEPKYLVCITPKGCYMIHSNSVEYNNDSKIILSSVYKNAIKLDRLTKKLGL